jgi:photosynthetic reaction center H subunit
MLERLLRRRRAPVTQWEVLMPEESDRVVPLGRMEDFRVSEGDPDVRGWEVQAGDGSQLGRVGELMIDPAAMKVRYLEVEVDPALVAGGRRVLVPIGHARVERDRDCVVVDQLRAEDLASHPAYDRERLDYEAERTVQGAFSHGLFGETVRADLAADARDRSREAFYSGPSFDEERFYASRRGRVVDPLAAARWGQVRGDEEGMRSQLAGESADESVIRGKADDSGLGQADGARNAITGEMGDPGGER